MMNCSEGTPVLCLGIVQHTDLQSAREQINRECKEGKNISEMIKEQKGAISSGKITNVGLHQIGKTVFYLVNMNNTNSKQIEKKKGEAARLDMMAKVANVNKIKALGKTPASFTIEQLKILLAPLRRHNDNKIPMKKEYRVLRLMEWDAWRALSINEEVAIEMVTIRSELQQHERNESYEEEELVLQYEELYN